MKLNKKVLSGLFILGLGTFGVLNMDIKPNTTKFTNNTVTSIENRRANDIQSYDINNVPDYSGEDYIELNGNKPFFDDSDMTTNSFEQYSDLDSLNRCGVAYANIGTDLMPSSKRGSIGMIKPSGWHTIRYDNVDGKYLYNRCHLIGYQLTGENANEKNLITCTRYTNTVTMLKFENQVAEYIRKTSNHVLYRVTPIFKGDNLVASAIQIEAKSVEDNGKGIEFNVYIYNIQDGIYIDYKTGDSKLKEKDGNYE